MNERVNIGCVIWGVKIRRSLWNIVKFFLFRPFGTKVFRLWRIALLKAFGAKLDWSVEVYASAEVWAPWLLSMEAGACLGPKTIVYNQARISLGRDVVVSQYAYLCTAGHEISDLNNARTGLVVAPITIENEAWIGTRAFISMGVEIGEKAVVGACACVYKDVAANTIVGGNPAKVLRTIE